MSTSDRMRKGATRGRGSQPERIDPLRARHLDITTRQIAAEGDVITVMVNDSESPLAWLARRKGRDGRTMITANQFVAGEKLRADFTRGQLLPRVTSDWSTAGRSRGGGGAGEMADVVITARQRVRLALDACGPEFSGLLLDVCCFLRGLEEVEHTRAWPSRSAKIVLQLALDRLARHYGLSEEARGRENAGILKWIADDNDNP